MDEVIAITRVWQQIFTIVPADQETFNEAVEYVRDHRISLSTVFDHACHAGHEAPRPHPC